MMMYPLLDRILWAIALIVPPLVILGAANPKAGATDDRPHDPT